LWLFLANAFGRYQIWELIDLSAGGELRNAVARAFDTEFFHPVSQGIWMEAKSFGSAVRTLDHAVSLFQYCQNVGSFNFLQGL
jgi:hypothetical protein